MLATPAVQSRQQRRSLTAPASPETRLAESDRCGVAPLPHRIDRLELDRGDVPDGLEMASANRRILVPIRAALSARSNRFIFSIVRRWILLLDVEWEDQRSWKRNDALPLDAIPQVHLDLFLRAEGAEVGRSVRRVRRSPRVAPDCRGTPLSSCSIRVVTAIGSTATGSLKEQGNS